MSTKITTNCYNWSCRPEDLNVLNSVREIQGALKIENWDESTFPYLSSVQYIGCNTSAILGNFSLPLLLDAGCDLSNHPVVILIHGNLELISLDLSSLKKVCGGSVVMSNNPQLCYVGDFNAYFTNSSQITCHGKNDTRDLEKCGNLSLSLSYPLLPGHSFFKT